MAPRQTHWWWEKNTARSSFIMAGVWLVIAAMIFGMALSGVIHQGEWGLGVFWLVASGIYLVRGLIQRRRERRGPGSSAGSDS